MKGRKIQYSEAELLWIREHCTEPRRSSHAEFQTRFDRPDVSLTNFNSLCKRNAWHTGRDGKFQLGSKAHNKGKKQPTRGRSADTQFKTGGLPHNHRGPGHERICKKTATSF